jgi:hypothetical protein
MGFLREDEKKVLSDYRKLHPQKLLNEKLLSKVWPPQRHSPMADILKPSLAPNLSPNKKITGNHFSCYFSPHVKNNYQLYLGY